MTNEEKPAEEEKKEEEKKKEAEPEPDQGDVVDAEFEEVKEDKRA